MTDEQKAVIEQLRSEGHAIAIIPPDEMPEDVNLDHVEELMTTRGRDAL